jgi:hypothetical protein
MAMPSTEPVNGGNIMESNTIAGGAGVASWGRRESYGSAVSWSAVIAGAFVAAALYLALLIAGSGFGFASMSPWPDDGASAATLGISAIVWLVVTQIISAGLGGYLAGRLRTKWVDVHSDEVYFRDTAHGFLVWAVGAVVSAVMLGSGIANVAGGAAQAGATAVSGMGTAAIGSAAAMGGGTGGGNQGASQATDYVVDSLFRSDRPEAGQSDQAKAEVGRIVTISMARGTITPEDKTYVAKVIAARAGIDQAAAEKRIDDGINRARQAADEGKKKARDAADQARKAAALLALWAFLSLLIGAFSASFAATIGGRARDKVG